MTATCQLQAFCRPWLDISIGRLHTALAVHLDFGERDSAACGNFIGPGFDITNGQAQASTA